ncbi:hypothetical protein [Actinoplanes sp. URMC 104]|uniref:hypothetical protein n=1 Tax=Actinoplanes sp. URMC 104 TaxID=3423409 RepID=UPI003F1BDAC6
MAFGRTVLRRSAGVGALAIVLASAGSAPMRAEPDDELALYQQCLTAALEIAKQYRETPDVGFAVACEGLEGMVVDPDQGWPPEPSGSAPSRPAPTPALTGGRAVCVTGPGRPVVGTTLTKVSAKARPGERIVYELQPLDGSETLGSDGSPVLEFGPGDLAPGGSYRWRARVDDTADPSVVSDDEVWSRWCEFTVSADAVDYTGLGDVSLEALTELGLRPDRTYTIRLSARQQRLLRAGTNIARTGARMTLTGPRWTDLLVQLTESAYVADEVAADTDSSSSDAPAYRALVDALSVKLGGPRHPRLG